jgi:hypothetical protein
LGTGALNRSRLDTEPRPWGGRDIEQNVIQELGDLGA